MSRFLNAAGYPIPDYIRSPFSIFTDASPKATVFLRKTHQFITLKYRQGYLGLDPKQARYGTMTTNFQTSMVCNFSRKRRYFCFEINWTNF